MTGVPGAGAGAGVESGTGATPPDEPDAPEAPAPDAREPDPPAPVPSPGPDPMDVADAIPQVLTIVGSIIAPTTLLTGLLFYFGRLHITGLFRYLGVNFTVLDLTLQDYLVRAADGLFVPLAVAAATALLLLWIYGFVMRALPAATRLRLARRGAPLVGLAGIVLLSLAAVGLGESTVFASVPELPGLCLVVGILLLAYAVRLFRSLRAATRAPTTPAAIVVAEWGAVFLIVSIGLFWAVGSYAIGVGASRGQQIEQQLSITPDAILYSEKSLSIRGPGVREVTCEGSDVAYRFRYEGLKLVLQSGEQYLFLPASWSRLDGAAVVIPRSEALRLDFSTPGAPPADRC